MRIGHDYIGVGVGAVVQRDASVLLLQRNKPPEAGYWSIPGGRVEFGETLEQAVIREMREELGCEAEIIAPLGVTNHIVVSERTHWVSPRFLLRLLGEPRNMEPEVHSSMDWFPLTALPTALTQTTRDALDALRAFSVARG